MKECFPQSVRNHPLRQLECQKIADDSPKTAHASVSHQTAPPFQDAWFCLWLLAAPRVPTPKRTLPAPRWLGDPLCSKGSQARLAAFNPHFVAPLGLEPPPEPTLSRPGTHLKPSPNQSLVMLRMLKTMLRMLKRCRALT